MECLSIGETTRASFRVETFDSVSEDAKNLYFSVSVFFLSLSILANCRHPRPHLPSRSVLRRGGKYLSWLSPTPGSSSRPFFVKHDPRASEELLPGGGGTLSVASSRLRKAPTRLRERRFDKDQTERTEENNWSAFVWIAGERTTLPKEFLLSRYLWPLLWSHGATDLWRPLSSYPHYVKYVRSICRMNNIVNFSIRS